MLLHKEFNGYLVLLSFALSFCGINTAIGVAEQLRLSLIDERSVHGDKVRISRQKKHLLYLFFASLGLGTVSVWGSFYASLYSMKLVDENGQQVRLHINSNNQILNFFLVTVIVFIALTISCYDDMFSKTKLSIINEFIAQSKRLTMKEIRSITLQNFLVTVVTKRLGRILVGGLMGGGSVLVIIYTGISGIVLDGHIEYEGGLTAVAVLASISAGLVGYWVFFRLLSVFPEYEWLRLIITVLGSMGTSACNYIVLASLTFHVNDIREEMDGLSTQTWDMETSFYVGLICSMALLWATAMHVMTSARYMLHRQGKFFQQCEAIVYHLAKEQGLCVPPKAAFAAALSSRDGVSNHSNSISVTVTTGTTTGSASVNTITHTDEEDMENVGRQYSNESLQINISSHRIDDNNQLHQRNHSNYYDAHNINRSVNLKHSVEQYLSRRCGADTYLSWKQQQQNCNSSNNQSSNHRSNNSNLLSFSSPKHRAHIVPEERESNIETQSDREAKRQAQQQQLHAERQQQANMSFAEYFVHLSYLLIIGEWSKLIKAIRIECCPDGSSPSSAKQQSYSISSILSSSVLGGNSSRTAGHSDGHIIDDDNTTDERDLSNAWNTISDMLRSPTHFRPHKVHHGPDNSQGNKHPAAKEVDNYNNRRKKHHIADKKTAQDSEILHSRTRGSGDSSGYHGSANQPDNDDVVLFDQYSRNTDDNAKNDDDHQHHGLTDVENAPSSYCSDMNNGSARFPPELTLNIPTESNTHTINNMLQFSQRSTKEVPPLSGRLSSAVKIVPVDDGCV